MNLGDKVYVVGKANCQPIGYEVTGISINGKIRIRHLDHPHFGEFYSDMVGFSTNLEKIKIQAVLQFNAKLKATMERYRITPI